MTETRGPWQDRLTDRMARLHDRMHANPVTGLITKVVITVIGLLVLGTGIVMMVTPGPGVVGILAGLGILALEWEFARRWLKTAREKTQAAAEKARAMDPAERRKRVALTALALVAAGGVAALLIWQFGWPGLAISGWNTVQSFSDVVPELPGM